MNKDLLTLSLSIFRHTFGISLWTKSDPTKLEEKVSKWKNEKPKKKQAKEKLDVHADELIDMPEEKPAKK